MVSNTGYRYIVEEWITKMGSHPDHGSQEKEKAYWNWLADAKQAAIPADAFCFVALWCFHTFLAFRCFHSCLCLLTLEAQQLSRLWQHVRAWLLFTSLMERAWRRSGRGNLRCISRRNWAWLRLNAASQNASEYSTWVFAQEGWIGGIHNSHLQLQHWVCDTKSPHKIWANFSKVEPWQCGMSHNG